MRVAMCGTRLKAPTRFSCISWDATRRSQTLWGGNVLAGSIRIPSFPRQCLQHKERVPTSRNKDPTLTLRYSDAHYSDGSYVGPIPPQAQLKHAHTHHC